MRRDPIRNFTSRVCTVSGTLLFLMVVALSGTAYPLPMTVTMDQWGLNNPAYPYQPVLELNSSSLEYAGVFSGMDTASAQRFYLFCADLFTAIDIGSTYAMELYRNFLATPLNNGGTPLTAEQMKVIRGEFVYLGLTPCSVNGLVPVNAQAMAGTTGSQLLSLTAEQAAAAQIALWEIVNEPWSGRNGIDLDTGNLIWGDPDGNYLTPGFYATFNAIVDGAFANQDVVCPVPEPSALLLMGVGFWGLCRLRRTGKSGHFPERGGVL